MKAYKIELLVLDFENHGVPEISSILDNLDIHAQVKSIDCREIGEWSDDHPLNRHVTAHDAYIELFK